MAFVVGASGIDIAILPIRTRSRASASSRAQRVHQRRRRRAPTACFASDLDLERVAILRAREHAAAKLERFAEARAARTALPAALRALPARACVLEANDRFYEDHDAMMRRWAPHGNISSVSAPGVPAVGQVAVSNEWARILAQGPPVQFYFSLQHVKAHDTTAWVVVKQKVRPKRGKERTYYATNVFRMVGAEWLLLHHHSSLVLMDTSEEQQSRGPETAV